VDGSPFDVFFGSEAVTRRWMTAYNNLKDLITADTAIINEKHLRHREWPVYATFALPRLKVGTRTLVRRVDLEALLERKLIQFNGRNAEPPRTT
jgi:hypothetical protein